MAVKNHHYLQAKIGTIRIHNDINLIERKGPN